VLKQKAGVSDYVKIIDFGISKFNQLSNEGMKMTKTGSVMGTPYYMSPEQANGSREADARSDLYAMGVILYECVTGAVPFDGKTFNELLFKIVLSDPPAPRQLAPTLDPAFEALILKAMAREVGDRFQTCEEFAQALRDYQAGRGMPLADVTGPMPAFGVAANAQQVAVKAQLATGANWSKTDGEVPKHSNAGAFAILGVVGVLVLAGGAFAAVKVMHSGSAAAVPSASAAERTTSEPVPTAVAPATPSAAPSAVATAAPLSTSGAKAAAVVEKPVVVAHPPAGHAAAAHPPKKAGGSAKSTGGGTDFGY
jgi:serine/threonine-protein kinase